MSRRVQHRLRAIAVIGVLAAVSSCAGGSFGAASVRSPSAHATRPSPKELPAGVPRELVGTLPAGNGVGVYDAAAGRLVRTVMVGDSDQLLAVSGSGRYAYISEESTSRRCIRRVDLVSGRSTVLPFCATDLAVSRDGRMLAYTTIGGKDNLTTSLVIRDLRTNRHRETLIYQNCRGCNNGVFGADLAWAPDDRRLAVSIYATSAIVSLQVLHAWRGSVASTPDVPGCRRVDPSCRRPTFDDAGRLIFIGEDDRADQTVVRLHGGRLHRLYRFAPHRYDEDPVVVDPRSDAFLWQDSDVHGQDRRTLLWDHGQVSEIASFQGQLSSDALWR